MSVQWGLTEEIIIVVADTVSWNSVLCYEYITLFDPKNNEVNFEDWETFSNEETGKILHITQLQETDWAWSVWL